MKYTHALSNSYTLTALSAKSLASISLQAIGMFPDTQPPRKTYNDNEHKKEIVDFHITQNKKHNL